MRTLGEIQPGMTLGRYEFLVPIAQGGMAAVWAARLKGSRGFSKTVAVKTMLPTVSDDPQFEQMFLDEAQLASRIRHPNVAEILDLGEQDDVLYLVMEWVDGEPISAIRRAAAKKGGIPRPIAVKIIQDACAGLHGAHELKDESGKLLNLVHRDISPQNILVTYDGVVKIVDFGVAKAAGRTSQDTNAGQIKGKPPYMSPEQARGEDIDRRTDIFALGIILYQLTTGKHPFRGESDVVTLNNIVSDRPIVPPRAYDPDYPRPLEQALMKALERDAEKRYQTAAEFEQALDEVFPPASGRVRNEDVGKFTSALLGSRGEERRRALTDAIQAADERASGLESDGRSLQPLAEIGSDARASLHSMPGYTPPQSSAQGGATLPDLAAARAPLSSEPHSSPNTPYGAAHSTPPRSSGKGMMFVLLGGGLALALIVGAVAFVQLSGSDEPKAAAPAAAPESPEAPEPAPTEPEASAEVPRAEGKEAPTGEVLDPSELALEPEGGKAAARPASGSAPVAAKPATRPAAGSKPPKSAGNDGDEKPAKPSKPSPGGFVPPPVTDPGF